MSKNFHFFYTAVTLKIRSRSPKPNRFFVMSQLHTHANLVRIQPLVHKILCSQELKCDADANADPNADANTNGICTKNNMYHSPKARGGGDGGWGEGGGGGGAGNHTKKDVPTSEWGTS